MMASMAPGLPLAIAAKLAYPSRQSVAVVEAFRRLTGRDREPLEPVEEFEAALSLRGEKPRGKRLVDL